MTHVWIPDLGGATMHSVDLGEYKQPYFLKTGPEIEDIFKKVPHYKFRDDDVMLITFQSTGTNWSYEMINMILNKSSKHVDTSKFGTMMEAKNSEDMERVSSPRVMNCHYPYRYLPVNGLRKKQIKTILCVRNPKDTAVSVYNHMRGLKSHEYAGKWTDWLPVYMQGKVEYGKYTDYLKGMETAIKEGVGFPLHVLYYEDLKSNGIGELTKLAQFLDVELGDDLKKDIVHMCEFDQMLKKSSWDITKGFFREGYGFLRKGVVGNWKSWFTVAQNEEFDEIWNKEMEGYDMFKFKYTL